MTLKDNLQKAPFHLTPAQVADVFQRLENLTLEEKVAQVYVLLLIGEREEDFELVRRVKPGGFTRYFSSDLDWEMAKMSELYEVLPIPPTVSADLEGSRQSFEFGTQVPNQMGLAAADDTGLTRDCAAILAREGKELGINWSFTPVIDINAKFRSTIVGTRSYGSDLARIKRHALAHIDGLQRNGIAATVKHWPGEGYDDRDQHLVTTVNPLSVEEWQRSYGELYATMIDAGVMSVMTAHIAFPAYMRSLDPDIGHEAYRPASINPAITTRLLREEMGFNGIVVSDATEMGGLGAWVSRKEAPPLVLAAGCDVILFSTDPERDMAAVVDAVNNGQLAESRLNEAVARVLALKAKLGLLDGTFKPAEKPVLKQPADVETASAAMAKAPTLVKDVNHTLPISVEKHRNVLVITNGIVHPIKGGGLRFDLPEMLAREGFAVTVYDPKQPALEWEKYDLILYLMGDESLLTRSHIFIDWSTMMGGLGRAMDRPWTEIPTVMVGFGHPYYLYDAPRVPTYINAYSTLPEMQKATLDALLGRRAFEGTSPVDPFCGLEDARF